MRALRVQVERVVRPIRASHLRKDQMREELLAHLTRLYDEEHKRTGDAETAADAAIQRFGDAASLARELQESVPWLERIAFFNLGGPLRRRPGESPARYIVRSKSWAWALGAVGCALFVALAHFANSGRPHRADRPGIGTVYLVMIGTFAIQGTTMIGAGLLCELIRQELEKHAAAATRREKRRAAWRIAGYAGANSALSGAAMAALMFLIEALTPIPFITRAQFWWITMSAVVLGLPLTLLVSWSWKATTRRFENWDSLDLDEQRAA